MFTYGYVVYLPSLDSVSFVACNRLQAFAKKYNDFIIMHKQVIAKPCNNAFLYKVRQVIASLFNIIYK